MLKLMGLNFTFNCPGLKDQLHRTTALDHVGADPAWPLHIWASQKPSWFGLNPVYLLKACLKRQFIFLFFDLTQSSLGHNLRLVRPHILLLQEPKRRSTKSSNLKKSCVLQSDWTSTILRRAGALDSRGISFGTASCELTYDTETEVQ